MKQGWIQSNTNGMYEDVAPKTLADLVYMDSSQTQTVQQALENMGNAGGYQSGGNTYLGEGAGQSAISVGQTWGGGNTYIGFEAGKSDPNGTCNTYVGSTAGALVQGDGNTFLGYNAGVRLDDPCISNAVYIGANTYSGTEGMDTDNEIVIGSNTMGGGMRTVTLGNWDIQQLRCNAPVITVLSDRRLKEEIQPANVDMCLEAVKSLPVTRYKYKDFAGEHVDKHVTGFLADDVEKVFPKSVTKGNRHFPVLDENGQKVYEEVEETVAEVDENGQPVSKVITRKVPQTFLMSDVKDLTMTEAVPTLWGAVQALTARLEALERR